MDPNNQAIPTVANADNEETRNIPIISEAPLLAETATLPSTNIGNQDALLLELGAQLGVTHGEVIRTSLGGSMNAPPDGSVDIIFPPLSIPADVLVGGTVNDAVGSTAPIEGATSVLVNDSLNGSVIGDIDGQNFQIGTLIDVAADDAIGGVVNNTVRSAVGSATDVTVDGANGAETSGANNAANGCAYGGLHGEVTGDVVGAVNDFAMTGTICNRIYYTFNNSILHAASIQTDHTVSDPVERYNTGPIVNTPVNNSFGNQIDDTVSDPVDPPPTIPVGGTYNFSSFHAPIRAYISGFINGSSFGMIGAAVSNDMAILITDQVIALLNATNVVPHNGTIIDILNEVLSEVLNSITENITSGINLNLAPEDINIDDLLGAVNGDIEIFYEPLDEFSDLYHLFDEAGAEHFVVEYDGLNDDQNNGEPEEIPDVVNPIDDQPNATQNDTENGNNQTEDNQSEEENNDSLQVYLVRNRYNL